MKQKFVVWLSRNNAIPYRFRKSVAKRIYPKILSDHEFEIDFYGLKYKGNTSDNTDYLFFFFGACEKYMLSFMEDYSNALSKKDFVFVDVGAHKGNHVLFMSKCASKILAFEANPSLAESLAEKIEYNGIGNVKVFPFGLGNENAKMPFYLSKKGHFSCGSFCEDHYEGNEFLKEIDIKIGDEVLNEQKIDHIDMIKIDVEGFERFVIEGFAKSIEKSRPVIISEISRTSRNKFAGSEDFASIFPKNYEFYQFSGVSRESDQYSIAAYDFDKHKKHTDVIAIPKEKLIYVNHKITDKLRRNKTTGGEE